jgi:6,7-dimethyl-8-ribityllumazine synthase
MIKEIGGELSAAGKKFAIVVSRFNDFLTTKLKDGAIDCLIRHGAGENDITVIWVPGSFEIPYVAGKLSDPKKYDAVICLGTVIRGQTPHFEYIAAETAKGIARIGIEKSYPAIYGIITADNLEQAIERAGTKQGNKGFQAALTAIEMVNLYGKI